MEFEFILLSPLLVWSTPLGLLGRWGISMHQHSTCGIKRRRRKKKCETPHINTWRNARLWVDFFDGLQYDKSYDIRKRNMITKSEIWTTNIRTLGFHDIREWVILRELILWSLGCTYLHTTNYKRKGKKKEEKEKVRDKHLKVTNPLYPQHHFHPALTIKPHVSVVLLESTLGCSLAAG